MTTRVVVTGAGVISSIGAGVADFERALYAGESAVKQSGMFGDSFTTAEIADFAPQTWLGPKGLRVLDRAARLVCVATHMAIHDSGLAREEQAEGDTEMGMACGTMFGALHSIVGFDWSGLMDGPAYVNPMEFPNTVINSPAGQAAIKFKLRGINSTLSAGLASGLYAIQYGAEAVRFGRLRVALAGGVEELCEESVLGFQKAGAGAPLGEGSAMLVIESAESAAARGVTPWAEVRGFGMAHDTDGAAAAIEQALAAASITPDEIGGVIASANGNRAGDLMEQRALSKIFGRDVPVSAPKAAFGEAMGASGALCALAGVLAARRGELPGGIAFEKDHVLVDAFSCDGNNVSMVLQRWSA